MARRIVAPAAGAAGRRLGLVGVIAGYQQFIARFAPLLAVLEQGVPLAPEQAFVIRTLLIHAYPPGPAARSDAAGGAAAGSVAGRGAYALARSLYRLTQAAAEQHIMACLLREDAGGERGRAACSRKGAAAWRDWTDLTVFVQAVVVEGAWDCGSCRCGLRSKVEVEVGPVHAARAEALDMEDLGDGGVLETGEFDEGQVQLLVAELAARNHAGRRS
jgi:hypothetical protein